MTDRIKRMIHTKIAAGENPTVDVTNFIDEAPSVLRKLTIRASNNDVSKYQIYGELPGARKWPTVKKRIKVGFISADWGVHPGIESSFSSACVEASPPCPASLARTFHNDCRTNKTSLFFFFPS
jgi:hypothetical protein